MLAAMLLTISVVALTQFALYYWRALLAAAASEPVSEAVLAAAGIENGRVTARDFGTFAGLHDLTPQLDPGRGSLSMVRVYYRIVDNLSAVAGKNLPALAEWCDRELAVCARYAAVQIERRLQANLELAAALRSC
jgi:hypothetical protein